MNLNDIDKKTYLNKGRCGVCYELQNGTVLKLFNEVKGISEIEKFKNMLKYKNQNFLFPFDFVYDEEKFYGYITKKSLGQTLEDSFSSINLEKFSTHSILLEKNIKSISDGKIFLEDFHPGNIMYDGNIIEVIDTDSYRFKYNYTTDDVVKENLKRYSFVIYNLLVNNIKFNKNTNYIIQKAFVYTHTMISVSEILIKLKETMEKYYKEEINTIDDLYAIIRR